jgi:hypothetical protein
MSNAIGFVVMGGLVVVGSAISFVKWHAKKACKDVQMVRALMNMTGCSLRVANTAKDSVRKHEAEYYAEGILTTALYEELLGFAVQYCQEHANA